MLIILWLVISMVLYIFDLPSHLFCPLSLIHDQWCVELTPGTAFHHVFVSSWVLSSECKFQYCHYSYMYRCLTTSWCSCIKSLEERQVWLWVKCVNLLNLYPFFPAWTLEPLRVTIVLFHLTMSPPKQTLLRSWE